MPTVLSHASFGPSGISTKRPAAKSEKSLADHFRPVPVKPHPSHAAALGVQTRTSAAPHLDLEGSPLRLKEPRAADDGAAEYLFPPAVALHVPNPPQPPAPSPEPHAGPSMARVMFHCASDHAALERTMGRAGSGVQPPMLAAGATAVPTESGGVLCSGSGGGGGGGDTAVALATAVLERPKGVEMAPKIGGCGSSVEFSCHGAGMQHGGAGGPAAQRKRSGGAGGQSRPRQRSGSSDDLLSFGDNPFHEPEEEGTLPLDAGILSDGTDEEAEAVAILDGGRAGRRRGRLGCSTGGASLRSRVSAHHLLPAAGASCAAAVRTLPRSPPKVRRSMAGERRTTRLRSTSHQQRGAAERAMTQELRMMEALEREKHDNGGLVQLPDGAPRAIATLWGSMADMLTRFGASAAYSVLVYAPEGDMVCVLSIAEGVLSLLWFMPWLEFRTRAAASASLNALPPKPFKKRGGAYGGYRGGGGGGGGGYGRYDQPAAVERQVRLHKGLPQGTPPLSVTFVQSLGRARTKHDGRRHLVMPLLPHPSQVPFASPSTRPSSPYATSARSSRRC